MGNRKRLRLPSFDYATDGAYFVTICAHRRRPIFARLSSDTFSLTPAGLAVERCWTQIPSHFAVDVDAFVVMPNHVHGIVILGGAGHAPPLPTVVGAFKSAATREVNRERGTPGAPLWQRGYHERVIRSERELEALREYVVNNPAAWSEDSENPASTRGLVSAPWL
jgi:putative transposase